MILHPVVYEDSDFSVYIEDNTIGWILHCRVYHWTNAVYRKMLDTLALIIESAPRNEVYAFSKNPKLTKFCEMFGMESIDTIQTEEGEGELLCLTL